ncbi:SH3 domain-containing protein [Halobacillus sp. Marseille-Q1614]|uniref:SH3 domain-containing protein n=1 Tax=Halobacillus sp. Marseille-Q1614 TaxID=2709134 RepID=UPI00157109C9|nr:SH3 domain-containing protein [Halobacillus sp. Marseille-Q1614]
MRFGFFKLLSALLFLLLLIAYFPASGTVTAEEEFRGVALKNPTKVYSTESRNSNVLKQYNEGSILQYREHSSSWYIATIYLNYKAYTGYIHKDDVENSVSTQHDLEGRAINNLVSVYEEANIGAQPLKSYGQGSILRYKTFSNDWYEATVYLDHKPYTGYIHKSHVETSVQPQQDLTGIALQNTTNVYSKAATGSKILKSYSNGTILQYKSFLNDWYEATVYLNHEPHTGYIHKSHVETGEVDGAKDSGIALLKPTNIYSNARTNSQVIKSFSPGTTLSYKDYSSNWYIVEKGVNGVEETGYLHKSHVEKPSSTNNARRGIGLQSPTHVFNAASTNSKPLKSYEQGSILQYKDFSANWYEATVYLNHEPYTGYIAKSHVENLSSDQQIVSGLAAVDQTIMYEKASKRSGIIHVYNKNDILDLKTFSADWYEAKAYINGESNTGYIHKDQVNTEKLIYETTNYDIHFDDVLEIQMTRTPKADGAGKVSATEEEVSYYLNPDNFDKNSSSFYQFLKLSQPAGLNAEEANRKVLYNAEILEGKASAFIEAGKIHSINEAYLISHAIHETGYGTSTLARGVPVDNNGNVVSESNKVHTVYNVYGIGAVDDSPVSGGAKRAFNEGWFTPEEAIIGGARFVSVNYVHSGQDTLYKMRWNPDNPGYHQYATHVAWADLQTRTISNIYDALNNYVLVYDVPAYIGQPSSSPKPDPDDSAGTYIEYPANVKGEVAVQTGSNLNLRSGPSINDSIQASIPGGSKIDVLGTNGSWYEVSFDGTKGWVSGEFVKLLNLLEVKASNLNVRTGPSTSYQPVGSLQTGDFVAGVLDNSDKIITSNEWYQINFNDYTAWASSGTDHSFIVRR